MQKPPPAARLFHRAVLNILAVLSVTAIFAFDAFEREQSGAAPRLTLSAVEAPR